MRKETYESSSSSEKSDNQDIDASNQPVSIQDQLDSYEVASLNSQEDYQLQEFSETSSSETNSSSDESASSSDENSSSSEDDEDQNEKMFCKELISIKNIHNVNKAAINEILKLVNKISNLIFDNKLVPSSYYKVEKYVKQDICSSELETHLGFACESCETNIYILKNAKKVKCPNCNTSIDLRTLNNSEHFWCFDIEQIIKIMLDNKELIQKEQNQNDLFEYYVDGEVYQEYLQFIGSDQKVVFITISSDGVALSNSSASEIWPIYLRFENLVGSQIERTCLLSSFYGCKAGETKPDVEFYTEKLIEGLIKLFEKGVYIEKLRERVYPMVLISLFDTPARAHFLNHKTHSGYESCTICTINGQRYCNHTIFKPEKSTELRTNETYNDSLKQLPSNGVLGECVLAKLPYYKFNKSSPPDVKHCVFGGCVKRLFNSMLLSKFKDKPCFMKFDKRKVLHKRLKNFGKTSDFKRTPRGLKMLHKWKTNEYFQFLFYLSPICLKSLVSDETYNHYMLLVFIISSLFKAISESDLDELENLMEQFQIKVATIYDDGEFTINLHLTGHLCFVVKCYGPLSEFNCFIFEHLNRKLKKSAKSSFSPNEQVRKDYVLHFYLNLSESRESNNEKNPVLFKEYQKSEGRTFFKNIKIDTMIFTSLESEKKKKSIDYYAKTSNGFFLISEIYQEDNSGFLVALKSKI